MRITAALSTRSVNNRSNIIIINNVGRLCVHTGVDERHLLEDKSKRIRRWGVRA
jgi:hypothetical protein